jgi:hypothetical protein
LQNVPLLVNPRHDYDRCLPIITNNNNNKRQQQSKVTDGSSILARAMLCDVLASVSYCCHQVRTYYYENEISTNGDSTATTSRAILDPLLFYAPPTQDGRDMMQSIVNELNLPVDWTLLPIDISSSSNNNSNCKSSNLSNVLSNVVRTGWKRHSTMPTTVILLGMDAPEVPIQELYHLVIHCDPVPHCTALLCPAYDGGYVLLSIPPPAISASRLVDTNGAPNNDDDDDERNAQLQQIDTMFQSINPYWSHPFTAMAQIKALSDIGIHTIIGPMVHDIDTPEDVHALIQRLSVKTMMPTKQLNNNHNKDDSIDEIKSCLFQPSAIVMTHQATSLSSEKSNVEATAILNHRRQKDISYVPCQYVQQALIDLDLLRFN